MSEIPSFQDPNALRVKICGLRHPREVEAACAHGAAYVGYVFFAASPRAIDAARAAELGAAITPGVCEVGLFVDPTDDELDAVLDVAPLGMLQLHGAETPERVAAIKARLGLPVMKAVGVKSAEDLAVIEAFEGVADQILCDAKPDPAAIAPGGAGVAFDWRLIAGRFWRKPWMLAGGLNAQTLAEAVRLTGARQVDVSSGVELRRGEKSVDLIAAFLQASKIASPA